jgi:hypothetical protein
MGWLRIDRFYLIEINLLKNEMKPFVLEKIKKKKAELISD